MNFSMIEWYSFLCLFYFFAGMNGVRHPMDNCQNQLDKRRRNYKLIVDPSIHSYMGNQKVYRFDGVNLVNCLYW